MGFALANGTLANMTQAEASRELDHGARPVAALRLGP